MLLGFETVEAIKKIEAYRLVIADNHRVYRDNNGAGKAHVDTLIDAIVAYLLGREIPGLNAREEDLPEIIKLREPASRAKYYEPPEKHIINPQAYYKHAKIAAGLVFYDEINVLKRCLDSLKDFDLVICIDGRYDVADGPPLSTDGSRELVMSYPNTLLVDMPFRQQTDLRNHYLDEATWNGCDYLLVIEADEYVTGDMKAFRESLPTPFTTRAQDIIFNIPMHYVGQNHVVMSPRFFYRPHLMRYGGTHSTYVIDGEKYLVSNGNESGFFLTLNDIMVNHDEKPRTKAQEDRAQKYQKRLIAQEREERTMLRKSGRVL